MEKDIVARCHHFHSYDKIGLTIFSTPFEYDGETIYAVGMALCHRTDNGNKKFGLNLAHQSAIAALSYIIDGKSREWNEYDFLFFENGVAVFRSTEALKNLIVRLRLFETTYGNSRRFSEFTKVFRGKFS
jgi:hypothetical protein